VVVWRLPKGESVMRHIAIISVCAILGVADPGRAASKQVTLRWHGQSFFEIESSRGTRIVLDPHAIDAYGRIAVRGDLVLISHYHNDHTQVEVVEDRAKAKIIVGLRGAGKKIDWNLVDETFRDVHVRTIGVYHDDAEGMERGKNAVFVIEVDGLRIVHLGDLGHLLTQAQIRQIGPVDVLLIPVGGVYTINGSEAKKVVEQLKPTQYIVPMHYGTEVFDEMLPVGEFLEDQNPATVKRFQNTNKLVIEAGVKRDSPIIAVLNWK
jgi:L-ascorbate metabolism protein UlaG (beta-lactamase superfamily)